MVRKRVIIGSICCGLIFSQLFALNACRANTNGEFQYNLHPRNPMEDEISLPIKSHPVKASEPPAFKHNVTPESNKICDMSVGFELYKDGYNRKVFIGDILPGSPAQKAGLRIGDEILRVNDKKVKKLSADEIFSIINSSYTTTLQIKDINKKKKEVNLVKNKLCITTIVPDEVFNSYWQQVYNGGTDLEFMSNQVAKLASIKRLHRKTKWEVQSMQTYLDYWLPKKRIFDSAYKACTISADTQDEFHSCMQKLVTRELAKIAKEEEYAHKRFEIGAKLKMVAMGALAVTNLAGSINNHAYALQHQNVYHNGNFNVNHSGTINTNIQHSGYLNLYHNRGYGF